MRPCERLATVVVVGMGLYAVKVLRDPFAFTYGDEFSHLRNLQSILASGRSSAELDPADHSPLPGPRDARRAVSRAAGHVRLRCGGDDDRRWAAADDARASTLLYDRLTGSPRVAGLGALVYAATPNFLFWSSQFAYESLALPLATVALFLAIRWAQEHTPQCGAPGRRRS